MSKSVVERPPAYRGPSKIPRFAPARPPLPDIEMENVNNHNPKPSKLMQLKSDYHDKIAREKEEKMVRLYEENQKKALNRVNSKGMVRDFFKERREIEGTNGVPSQIPTINQHFKQKRNEQKYGETDFFEKRKPPLDGKRGVYGTRNAVGRDKSNPLAPIERNNTSPRIARKPQIHARPWTKEDRKPKNDETFTPKTAPAPDGMPSGMEIYGSVTQTPSDDTPPPNLLQLKKLQKQKLISNRSNASPASQKTKMSDFEKWQAEQDENRSERLKKHSRMQNGSDEENVHEGDEDEIMSKQRELMEQIQRQKDELERMRLERQKEEEEERKEMEKRRKREEERRRKAKEDADRKKQQDEEQRKKNEEEMMAQARKRHEEEAQRRLEADSRMMTNRTNKTTRSDLYQTHQDNMDDDFVKAVETYRSAPSPPKNTKPVRVKRPSGNPKDRQRTETPPRPIQSPPREFKVDLSLYVDAAQDENAFASSRVKLVPCSKCGRKFAADRVERHMNSCDNLTKKRKILDPTKLRTAGTDMEKYVKNPKMRTKTPPKKTNWRQQHENFIQNLRYAKKVTEMEKTGQDMSNLPPPPVTENPDYVQCPHCSRTFNPTTAERHIPRCKAPPRKR